MHGRTGLRSHSTQHTCISSNRGVKLQQQMPAGLPEAAPAFSCATRGGCAQLSFLTRTRWCMPIWVRSSTRRWRRGGARRGDSWRPGQRRGGSSATKTRGWERSPPTSARAGANLAESGPKKGRLPATLFNLLSSRRPFPGRKRTYPAALARSLVAVVFRLSRGRLRY